MEKQKKFSIPWQLLALDFLGAGLVAWGFYQFVSEGSGVFYIITGLFLMLPLVLHIVNYPQKKH